MDQGCLPGFTSHFGSSMLVQSRLPQECANEADDRVLVAPGKPTVTIDARHALITYIRVTHISTRLRRLPVGFYVVVKSESGTYHTANKPAVVGEDDVEWDEKILLPSESKISIVVLASFGLGSTQGDGEVVRQFDVTVGELLNRNGSESKIIKLSEQDDDSVEIKVQSITGSSEYAAAPNPIPRSEETGAIQELTDAGHSALVRYRELQEERDLDESIRYFELARDLCPSDHSNRATVLFNLANAKLTFCRVNFVSLDLAEPIDLYRTALSLRPRGHPDHASTLLSLGVSLKACFQRQGNEVDKAEGDTLLSQVLDVSAPDSYVYHAAIFALHSAMDLRLLLQRDTSRAAEQSGDVEEEVSMVEKVDRLDATLQWIFCPDSRLSLLDPLGVLFCIQLNWISRLIDRERAISVLDVTAQYASDNHPHKLIWLVNLEQLLWNCYEHSKDIVDLEKLISLMETTVRLMPNGHPQKSARLGNLAVSLLNRYDRLGNLADLEKSISLKEDTVRLTPDGDPNKPIWLGNHAMSLLNRYTRFGSVVDLEESISLSEDALLLTPDGHPEKPTMLGNLARSLSSLYERVGNVADLEKFISLNEDVLQLTPDGHPDRPSRLGRLAASLSSRYERFGDIVDLEKSISLEKDAVDLMPDGDPDKPLQLGNLAYLLWSRYKHFGDIADLKQSISFEEDAAHLTPDGHPHKPLRLNNLALSLSNRHERFGDITDLEKSISLMQEAVRLIPDGHPEKPRQMSNLARSLLTRYECLGDVGDLEKSISLEEDGVHLTPDGHPDKPLRLTNLAHSLSTRFERFGEIADLEKSISLRQDAVHLTPDGHPDKPRRLSNLASSFWSRYDRFGDIMDLEKSITMERDAVQLTPNAHPDRPQRLGKLGRFLLSHYERFGDIDNLEESISLMEDAVHLTPDDHPDKPSRLCNLAASLSSHYERFGDTVDLNKSLSLEEDAVNLTPDGHPDRPLRLSNLASSLSSRHKRFRDIMDLEKSISLKEEALRLTPDGRPDKPGRLHSLAFSLASYYECLGDTVDLKKSISLEEDALRLAPNDHTQKPTMLTNLARLLSSRYERLEDIVDLEKSISLNENALRLMPDGHPDKTVLFKNIALSHLQSVLRLGETSSPDLRQAISYFSQAVHSSTGLPSDRMQSSRLYIRCLRLLRQEIQSLFDAYTVVLDLLPRLAWIGKSFQDRYYQLIEAAGLVPDAAAVAIGVDRPELAIEWLEQGRSIVWSQVLQLRTPVDDLRAAYPGLATQFERVSHELEHVGVQCKSEVHGFANHSNMTDGLLEHQAHQQHKLAHLYESLLTDISALPGFERFLLPKTIDQLSSLVHSGYVIILNAGEQGCDALVIPAASKKPLYVPLPHTSYDKITNMRRQLSGLLRYHDRIVPRDEMDREGDARPVCLAPDDMFRSVLSNLWDDIVSPVLAVLGLLAQARLPPAELPRIFWCPTGPLTFLPIHAAGIYDAAKLGPKLSNFVVSSYIPTMSTLPELPQQDSLTTSSKIGLLAVPQPGTDGGLPLNGVEEEMGFMRELASSSPFVDFEEADGTVEDVLKKMKRSDWVHFCCHGTQDRTNPLDSGLLLANRTRLKLSDVVQLSRHRRGIAFLSACQTAMGDEKLSDEAIHLAAGMLLAGYSGVIATMWSIMDRDAPGVTKDVYTNLVGDGRAPDSRRAAEALHYAIEKLRDSGAPFLSWVPFVHYGL